MIVKPKDLAGAYVGLHFWYQQGLLYFYCHSYRAYAKIRPDSKYGKDLDCDHCFVNFKDLDRIQYKTCWTCRKIGTSAPITKRQIKDMFDFISKPFSNSKKNSGVS